MMSSKISTSATFNAKDAESMRPFASDDTEWGWTHYGFYVLDLPAPWGYLNANTVIGTAGSHTFNRPATEQKNLADCRRDASLHVSTGGSPSSPGGWQYSMYDTADPAQAELAEDGRTLRWTHMHTGGDSDDNGTFEIRQAFPEFHLRGRFPDWNFSLTIRVTQVPAIVTQFARIPRRYEHFSLMATAEGYFCFKDGTNQTKLISPPLKWPANIEYARSITPQMFSPTRLPLAKMVPDTTFTYQVLTVDSPANSVSGDNFQILLARIGTRARPSISALWLRSIKFPERNAGFLAHMRVVRYQRVETPGGDADRAIVPAEISWIVHDPISTTKDQNGIRSREKAGKILEITVFPGRGVSCLWRGKFGAGYNTGCEWTGTYRGKSLLEPNSLGEGVGRGHVEWVDTETSEKDLDLAETSLADAQPRL